MTIKTAALKAGMSEPTAHSYLKDRKLPSERKKVRNYRRRPDAFAQVWEEADGFLKDNPRLEGRHDFLPVKRFLTGKQFSFVLGRSIIPELLPRSEVLQ